MKKYKALVLFGEGGSGKDTIVDWLYKKYPNNFHKVVSYTTRPRRLDEENGFHYYFISPSTFEKYKKNNYFLETSLYNNNWQYGTSLKEFKEDKVNLCVLDINGVRNLSQREDFECIFIKVEVSATTRLNRMISRVQKDYSDKKLAEACRRFYKDYQDFTLFEEDLEYLNDNLKNNLYTYYNIRDIDYGFDNLLNINHLKEFTGLNKKN